MFDRLFFHMEGNQTAEAFKDFSRLVISLAAERFRTRRRLPSCGKASDGPHLPEARMQI